MPAPADRPNPTLPEPANHNQPSTGDYRSLVSTGIEPPSTLMTGASVSIEGARRGRFTILRAHARGGLGQVSLAHDEKLKRNVALKEIRPDRQGSEDLRHRFVTEAEITGMLEHPGIVPVYAMDDGPDGEPYYAMRFIEGRTLAEAIREFHGERGRVSAPSPPRDEKLGALTQPRSPDFVSSDFRQLLQRFVAVCNTIAYAHSKGVIHRDLKPANIMLGDYGETLVVDWGLAKKLGEGEDQQTAASARAKDAPTSLTQAGQVLGTPAYMSPEQARGEEIGSATDIYALGAILYDLLTGRPPYVGKSAIAVLEQVRTQPPAAPTAIQRKVPKALEAICQKALSRKPTDRYATATDLARDVERWLADEPVSACSEPWSVRAGRWSRKHRTLVTSAAAVLVVAVFGLATGLTMVSILNGRLDAANTNLVQTNKHLDEARKEALVKWDESQATANFLDSDLLSQADINEQSPGYERNPNITVAELLDRASAKVGTKFKDRPLIEAWVRRVLGGSYVALGKLDKGQPHLEEAVRIYTREKADNSPAALLAVFNLATAHHRAGRFNEAESCYREILHKCDANVNLEEWNRLNALSGLGALYQEHGRYDLAESFTKEALERQRVLFGEADKDTLQSMNNLAGILHKQGKNDQALPLFLKILEARTRLTGEEDTTTLMIRQNLGVLYHQQGKLEQAESHYLAVLNLLTQKRGANHRDTLVVRNNLAAMYAHQEKYDLAAQQAEEVLKVQTEQLGRSHPHTLNSIHNLAGMYEMTGRITQAIQLFEEVVTLKKSTPGLDELETMNSQRSLAIACSRAGQAARAEHLLREVLTVYEKRTPDHWRTASVRSALGGTLRYQGKLAEAEPLLLQAYDGLKSREANIEQHNRAHISAAVQHLVLLYDAWNKPAEAEKWRAQLPAAEQHRFAVGRQHAWPVLWGWPRF